MKKKNKKKAKIVHGGAMQDLALIKKEVKKAALK